MSLVYKIKRLCEDNDITVTKLERVSGLGRSTIRNWDKSFPNTDNLQKVADYFHVSTDYLLSREYNQNLFDFQFSVSRSVHLTEEDKEKLIKTFKDITNLYLDAKGK